MKQDREELEKIVNEIAGGQIDGQILEICTQASEFLAQRNKPILSFYEEHLQSKIDKKGLGLRCFTVHFLIF